MNNKISRPSFHYSNKTYLKELILPVKKKYARKSIKKKPSIKGGVISRLGEKLKQTYLNREKDYEKKVLNILNKNIYKHKSRAQDNFYTMIISNIMSDKSHRIKTKYSERFLELNPFEMLFKYYKRNDSYDNLKYLTKAYNNNVIFFPNYFVNQNVYYIMGQYLEEKEKIIIKAQKYNKLKNIDFQLLNIKKRNRFQDISNKILESFSEDNKIDVENNLKNLNDESFDYSHNNLSNSSHKIKNLIYELNNNMNQKKNIKKIKKKDYSKLKTKIYEKPNIIRLKSNLKIKRLATVSKPITFDKSIIVQKLYLDDFLAKRFDYFKNRGTIHKINENDINLETYTNINNKFNQYFSRNPININNYTYKNRIHNTNYFKPTDLFIFDFFKEQHLNRKLKIKQTIINSIKEYKTLKTKKIISFLKAKENAMIKGFSLSSSRKKLKNFVQKDGFTTEITQVKDILKQQKLKDKKALLIKGNFIFNDNKELKKSSEYIPSQKLFYRNNDRYINLESLTERIKLNINKLIKKKQFSKTISLLFKKT